MRRIDLSVEPKWAPSGTIPSIEEMEVERLAMDAFMNHLIATDTYDDFMSRWRANKKRWRKWWEREPKPVVRKPIPIASKKALAERHGGRPGVRVEIVCGCGATGSVWWSPPVQPGKVGWIHFRALHIDHIKPVSKGGTNEPENLRLLCPFCNMSRGNREDA